MKLLKEYGLSVCVAYTILAMTKVFVEGIGGKTDPYYLHNFTFLFLVVCFATFVLFMHRIFHKVPLLIVMIAQYGVIIAGVFLGIFFVGTFTDVSSHAYREMFWQITVPYIPLAGIYYIAYFREVKKANKNLGILQKMEAEK